MTLGGYANRIAHIDLTSGEIDYQPIPEDWALKYIGGRGLGVKYVFENGPQVDPLSPDNILCFMNGPLTGTEANMSGRLAVVTKSPLTGTVTDSHHGGWSAARLRWAGFDGLIFKGKASKPVYAYDVDYVIGKSDFRKDWFFEHVPRNENPANTTGTGSGRATTWSIRFDAPALRRGRATLRLAICGVGTRRLSVALNGSAIGEWTDLVNNATINRDGIGGSWSERTLAFDAALLVPGENVLTLTVPAGPLTGCIINDYLRLELDGTGTVSSLTSFEVFTKSPGSCTRQRRTSSGVTSRHSF